LRVIKRSSNESDMYRDDGDDNLQEIWTLGGRALIEQELNECGGSASTGGGRRLAWTHAEIKGTWIHIRAMGMEGG
jgi:hypothetical protein